MVWSIDFDWQKSSSSSSHVRNQSLHPFAQLGVIMFGISLVDSSSQPKITKTGSTAEL